MYKLPYLQKYKGKSTRFKCPSCGRMQSFTLYLDGNTHEPIHQTVGRCNREIKCGYHYTPKQYFIDNPSLSPPLWGGWEGSRVRSYSSISTNVIQCATPSPLERVGERFHSPPLRGGWVGSIPFSYLRDSLSPASNFVSFLQSHFSEDQINSVFEKYLMGATKNKEVIFWQIDIQGRIRTGKIMQYNPQTGKRIKHQNGAINWVHNKLKKTGALPDDFNLQQCFFGEHLLKLYPDKSVAIVESEKTACIASCIIPELIWLAAGSLNGLSVEKCRVLKNRKVILFPDQGAFDKWNLKAAELRLGLNQYVFVSDILEREICVTECFFGFDVVDFILWP
jgi:hypothetical protein